MLVNRQIISVKGQPMHWRASGHKYGAKPVTIDGIRFASTKEGNRFAELKLLARAGEITSLQLQPVFEYRIRNQPIFKYVADFAYFTREGQQIIEDVKGVRTPLYKLKKKIIEAEYGITIMEL